MSRVRTRSSTWQKEKAREKYHLDKSLSTTKTPWCNLPKDWFEYEAFVYEITHIQTNKKYIGFKNFWTKRKTTIIGESNWAFYKSSSINVLRDISTYGVNNFTFTILSVHRTAWGARQEEAAQQFKQDVLVAVLDSGEPAYYNDNIMSKFFRPKEFGTEEYYKKCDQISQKLKEGYNSGRIVHGMLGKIHPNKGKKLPQTGHLKNKGKVKINNGIVNKCINSTDPIPEGFSLGMVKRKVIEEEKIKPERLKVCPLCKKDFIPNGTQKYCSPEHTKEAKAIRTKELYAERTKDKIDKRKIKQN